MIESGLGEAAAGAAHMAADEEWGDDEALDGGIRARRAARSFLMTSEATSILRHHGGWEGVSPHLTAGRAKADG